MIQDVTFTEETIIRFASSMPQRTLCVSSPNGVLRVYVDNDGDWIMSDIIPPNKVCIIEVKQKRIRFTPVGDVKFTIEVVEGEVEL